MKKTGKFRIALTLIAVLLLAVSLATLAACGGGDDDTTTEPIDTTPLEDRAFDQISNIRLGLSAYSVESSNPRVASANALPKSQGLRVVAHNEGTTTLTVSDYFGRTTTVEVTIGSAAENYSISYEAKKCDDHSIVDVRVDYKAFGNGSSNDTAAIQKAIDYGAENGLDVCFPAGVYLIDKLELREGSVIRLQGKASDYIGEGCMTRENYDEMKSGNHMAVLKTSKNHKFMCINNEYQKAPTTGKSNIVFQGGVFDMQSSNYGGGVYSFVFTCGDNILLEDTAMLDCYNEHTIQVSGCTNVTIKNCIFAGYVYEGDIRREALQVESAGNGCNSAAKYKTDYSERYTSSDVLIEGCYFGPTPVNPAPPMGVGHHGANGQNGKTDATNLTIRGCIFEECGYAAIRQPNSEGLVIEDNTFVVTGTSNATKLPSCIDLYIIASQTSYKVGNREFVISTKEERYGVDARITGNTFKIGGDTTNYRVLQLSGAPAEDSAGRGATTISPVNRQDYTDGPAYIRRGFIVTDRTFHDIIFSNNTINITAKSSYNAFITASSVVYGFEYENNTLNTSNTYTQSWNGNPGLQITARNGADSQTRVITSSLARNMVFTLADGSTATMISASATNRRLELKTDGNGRIFLSTDSDGNLYISTEGYEGYVFDGWYTASGAAADISGTMNNSLTFVAHFVEG